MKLKIKKLSPNATIPKYAKPGDAALDFIATSINDDGHIYIEYGTSLAIEIPEGHVGLLFPRSSISNKALILSNSVGVIDSGYRGEIKFRFYLAHPMAETYVVGDKVGQLMVIPYPTIELEEVDTLTETDRGNGGYGSTGN